jgi:hypothetical protein
VRLQAAALVVAVGHRQHDAVAVLVDVGARQDLAVELVEQLLGLRIDDLRLLVGQFGPVAERSRDRRFENDGIAPIGGLRARARGDPGNGRAAHQRGQDKGGRIELHGLYLAARGSARPRAMPSYPYPLRDRERAVKFRGSSG